MPAEKVSIDPRHAALIARRFLERDGCDCENPGPDCPTLTGSYHEYLAGTDSVVYEFPLTNKGNKSGYIVISGSHSLPPILEFCPTGQSLREILTECLSGLMNERQLHPKSTSWQYFGPLDFVAELEMEHGEYYYARLPNLHIVRGREKRRINAPRYYGDHAWLQSRWEYYETETAPKGGLPCSRMFGITTVRYNQTCQSS